MRLLRFAIAGPLALASGSGMAIPPGTGVPMDRSLALAKRFDPGKFNPEAIVGLAPEPTAGRPGPKAEPVSTATS